jgi:hypothetical protein
MASPGLISDRTSRFSLDGPDWDFVEAQKYLWNPLIDYWFRMEMEGWDGLPDPPALLVGIHSGAPLVWDAWTVGVQWWRHFGRSRPLHGTAHDLLMGLPVFGPYFRRMGVLPARCNSVLAALRAGHDVALWPVLATGRRVAKALRLDKLARLKMFPIVVQAPWGISPALLPEIPFPTKIRTAFQEPTEALGGPGGRRRRAVRRGDARSRLREHPARHGRPRSPPTAAAVRLTPASGLGWAGRPKP